MNKRIKVLLAVLCVSIFAVFAFTACGNGGDTTNQAAAGNQATGSQPAQPGPSPDGTVDELVMAFMTWVLPGDTQQIQDAMNEILIPRYGISVELLIMDAASYQQNIRLMLTAGEQVDVMSTLFAGFVHLQSQGFLLDLEANNLIQNFGPGIPAAVGGWEILNGARIAGTLYGVPTNCDHAVGRGSIVIGTQYLEAIGFDVPNPNNDIIHITVAELNGILHQLNEAFPDIETIRPTIPGGINQFMNFDPLGPDMFGVLLDPANDLTVSNLFTSQEFYDFISMMHEWNNSGFISLDAAADDTPVTALVAAGRLMAYMTGGKPGIVAQESTLCAMPVTVFQTGQDIMNANAAARFPWAIPFTTADPTRAMTLLNAIYTDPDLSNLLVWGIEGVHYEHQASGHVNFPAGLDAGSSGWSNGMGWAMPNQFITHVWAGDDLDLYQQLVEFNDNAIISRAFGFIFDPFPVQNEITASTNAFDELITSLGLGMVDPATGIAQLNDRLTSAGLYRIIAEKQRQLDEWAAATGA